MVLSGDNVGAGSVLCRDPRAVLGPLSCQCHMCWVCHQDQWVAWADTQAWQMLEQVGRRAGVPGAQVRCANGSEERDVLCG